MKKLAVAFLLAASAPLPLLAQNAPPPPPIAVDPKVTALRDAALDDDYACDITEGLTTEVGQRKAGTEAEARARTWGAAKLRQMGFANVRVDKFPVQNQIRGFETAEILAPFPQKLVVNALGNSASTGPAGITGEVVGFDSVDALRLAPDAAIRGKIVFIDHHMPANQDGSGYGQFGAPRRQGPTIASLKGAIGIVIRSIGTDHNRTPHTGVMTQNWSMRVPLIDGQGNFGSMDPDPPAAMRYTEARLAKVANFLLGDIDKDTVNFQPNYDASESEPQVLPARFPNLLVNGAGGIAVGMATNIPPHNLGEVLAACRAFIDDPAITTEGLMEHAELGRDKEDHEQVEERAAEDEQAQ